MSLIRSDVKVVRQSIAGALFVLILAVAPLWAGDEVDYSAPYLVVENGELVTKYPAIDHEAGNPDSSGSDDAGVQMDDDEISVTTWRIVIVALAVAAALLLLARRRSRRDRTDVADRTS